MVRTIVLGDKSTMCEDRRESRGVTDGGLPGRRVATKAACPSSGCSPCRWWQA